MFYPKIKMTHRERLLRATTGTQFFVVLCQLLSITNDKGTQAKITSVQNHGDFALALTITQAMRYKVDDGWLLQWDITHVFTLEESGLLTWKMKDEPLVIGVEAIQDKRRKLWDKTSDYPLLSFMG